MIGNSKHFKNMQRNMARDFKRLPQEKLKQKYFKRFFDL